MSRALTATLVTGVAGFVRSHVVEALFTRDTPVTILDDFSPGREANIPIRDGLRVVRDEVVSDADAVADALLASIWSSCRRPPSSTSAAECRRASST